MVLAAQDGPLPPWPQLRPGSLPLARAALLLQVPPWVGASGWLPHGRGRHVALRSLVGALQERDPDVAGSWADGRTWIVAMDYDTGQRVLFGHPGAPPRRWPTPWSPPARFRAGTSRPASAATATSTAASAPPPRSASWPTRTCRGLRARADGQQ